VYLLEPGTKLNKSSFIKQNISATLLFRLFSFALIGVPPSFTFFVKIRALRFILNRGSAVLGLRLLLLSSFFIYAYASLILEGLSLGKARGSLVSSSPYGIYLVFLIVWVFPVAIIILEDSI
jgi:NADH:ubiquinone oxidoreductase subunit 2 (subunit N)